MYMDNKEEVGRLKGSAPKVNYCSALVEIANKINRSERWICFDSKEKVDGNRFYYYQDRISHCNARIEPKCKERDALSIKFSFVEIEILKETLHELGLPINKFS